MRRGTRREGRVADDDDVVHLCSLLVVADAERAREQAWLISLLIRR